MKNAKKKERSPRIGAVGGQAVLEGVMMKSTDRYSVAVRKDDGSISVSNHPFTSVKDRCKLLKLPIVRGVVNFIETLQLSFKTLTISAEAMGIDELEPESRFEKWLVRRFGENIMNLVMGVSTVFAVLLCVVLFIFLPSLSTKGIDILVGGRLGWFKNLIEGVIKILIFIAYLALVSLMPDIRRTYEYHGAEHKSIFCYENGEELTPENVKKYKRFHPRCGTSFLFIMMIISIVVASLPFMTWDNLLLRLVSKLLLLLPTIGIGYEFIRYAGTHENALVRILSAPGLWIQRITTREPDYSQMEVAIAALKSSLPKEFPDYKPEPPKDAVSAVDSDSDESTDNADASVDSSADANDGDNTQANAEADVSGASEALNTASTETDASDTATDAAPGDSSPEAKV